MDFLGEIERKLDLPPAEKEEVVRELKSHYEELRTELVSSGMDAGRAEEEAARRLGDPRDIAARMGVVHCQATWKSAVLAALPFAAAAAIAAVCRAAVGPDATPSLFPANLAVLVPASFGLLLISVSARELVLRRRPIWLATWLATACVMAGEAHRAVLRVNPGYHQVLTAWHSSILILVLGAATAWAFRKSPTWRGIYLGITLLGTGARLMVYGAPSMDAILAIVYLLCAVSCLIGLALKVFAWHPYGNVAQSSLFLFVLSAPISLRYGPSHQGTGYVACAALMVILGGATVLVFARARTWPRKLVALSAGLSAMVMVYWRELAGFGERGWYAGGAWLDTGIAYSMVLLVCVVLIPLLFDRFRRSRRPEFVQ